MREFVTYEQAVAMLPDDDEIHTFVNSAANILLGADWSREDVLEFFRKHDGEIELSGENATRMKHGLAHGPRRLFFATKE